MGGSVARTLFYRYVRRFLTKNMLKLYTVKTIQFFLRKLWRFCIIVKGINYYYLVNIKEKCTEGWLYLRLILIFSWWKRGEVTFRRKCPISTSIFWKISLYNEYLLISHGLDIISLCITSLNALKRHQQQLLWRNSSYIFRSTFKSEKHHHASSTSLPL